MNVPQTTLEKFILLARRTDKNYWLLKLFKPFGENSKVRRAFRKKVKKKLVDNPVSSGINEALKEIQAAMTAATVASIASTSAGSN